MPKLSLPLVLLGLLGSAAIATPAKAQVIPYNNLEGICEGRVINTNICVKPVGDNEIRYLTINSEQGLVTISVGIAAGSPVMSIKIEGQEGLHFVVLDGEGSLFYESEQGNYDVFNRYFSNEFIYLFSSY